jgi:PhzF family phenazine biosynthesis protein
MSGRYVFDIINAFSRADCRAIGNPASICLVEQFPGDNVMGDAARKLGSPMTSFMTRGDQPDSFNIRHFSPDGAENHVCGHATVAASEFLARLHPEYRQGREIAFRLNPRYAINADNEFRAFIQGPDITLTMPAISELERVDDPAFYTQLAKALGIRKRDIDGTAYYAPRIINYVIGIRSEKKLQSITPDFNRLAALARSVEFPHEGIMLTAKPKSGPYDLMSRVFLPVIGVDEDIACGSSMCSIVPYWVLKQQNAFPSDKRAFSNLFIYPPAKVNGNVGGVQHVQMDDKKGEIRLTGQASYQRQITLSL